MRKHLLTSGLTLLLGFALAGGGTVPASAFVAPPPLNAARPVRELRLAAGADGALVLALITDDQKFDSGRGTSTARDVTAWRYAGGSWTPLGGVLNYSRPRPASTLDLALDLGGAPVLAWNENYADNDVVVFRAFRGGAWTDWRARYLGDDLPYAARTRAVAARGGEPVLVWGESLYPRGSRLTVREWNGQSWVRGPAFNDIRAFSRQPALALGAGGRPVVAWLQGEVLASNVRAARWTGTRWETLGGSLNRRPDTYLAAPRLVLDARGRPTAAWLEDVNGQDTLFASRWNGGRWEALGQAVSTSFASAPSLAVDAAGHAVLAWVEERGGVGHVRFARWTGAAWQDFGVLNRDAARDARSPSVTVSTSGEVLLAWREDVGGVYQLELRRFDP